MHKGSDCTIVTCSIRLQDLKQWKMNGKETIRFYFTLEIVASWCSMINRKSQGS